MVNGERRNYSIEGLQLYRRSMKADNDDDDEDDDADLSSPLFSSVASSAVDVDSLRIRIGRSSTGSRSFHDI